MVNLLSKFDTKYIHDAYYKDLEVVLKELKGEDVDIADARLTKNTWALVQDYNARGLCTCHDTLDPERDRVLKINRQRYLEERNTPVVEFFMPKSIESMESVLDSYVPGQRYKIMRGSTYFTAAWVILVQAARPEIDIDLGAVVIQVFELISSNLLPSEYPPGPVYYRTGTTFDTKDNPDKDFILSNMCVPVEFGQACLYKKGYVERWDRVLQAAERIVNREINQQHRHISDFL